jgi:transposase
MERIPYGKYTKEFRQEAVKLVIDERLSVLEVGRRLYTDKDNKRSCQPIVI